MFFIKKFYNFSKPLIKSQLINRFKSSVSYSYSFEPSLEPLSALTIGQLVEDCAHDSGDRIACISVHQNISKTYSELNSDAIKLALSLKQIGCRKGDRIGIWAPNCYEWLLTQYATAKLGAIMVNVNPAYRANELEYCLNLVECHTLICSQRFRSSNYCDILNTVSPDILNTVSGHQVFSERIPSLKNLIMINSDSNESDIAPKNIMRFNDLLSTVSDITEPIEEFTQFDDSINIQFTSGTTGHPKAATLTHHNIIQNAYFVGKRSLEGLDSSNLKICVPNPLYHCFGCVLGSILIALRRGTLVLPAPVFNPHKTLEAIHNFKCDMVYGTPTMYIDLLNSNPKSFNTSSLVRGIMAGALCPPPLLDEIAVHIPSCEHILIPYGTTECSPVVSHTSINDSKKHRLHSVGRPLDYIELKVIDPNTGALLRTGESGEVCMRGHCSFVGYWAQKQLTDDVLDRNNWYHSGDMGFMDELGYLYINGRIKDMIIRGGENIYPKEIEDFLMSHPTVADAQVVGISDHRLGEELVAYIRLKTNGSLDHKEIKEFCDGKISHFKIPKNIEFVEDYPRTVTGKVQKFKLREIAEKQFKK